MLLCKGCKEIYPFPHIPLINYVKYSTAAWKILLNIVQKISNNLNKKRKETLLQPTRQRTFRYLPQLLFLYMIRVFIRQVFPVVINIQLPCHTGFLLVQQ